MNRPHRATAPLPPPAAHWWTKVTRSTVLLVFGLGFLTNEFVLRPDSLSVRPWPVGAGLLLCGYPVVSILEAAVTHKEGP